MSSEYRLNRIISIYNTAEAERVDYRHCGYIYILITLTGSPFRQSGSQGLLSFRTRIGLKHGPLVTATGIVTSSDDTLFLPLNTTLNVPVYV